MAKMLSGILALAFTIVFWQVALIILGATLVWLHYLPHWRATPDPATKLAVFCTAPALRHTPSNCGN